MNASRGTYAALSAVRLSPFAFERRSKGLPEFSFNSNIASIRTQRQLAASSASTRRTFERLSSGLRINRASDDAAGLSIAESLNVDSRVYTQAIRNANDGISVLDIAAGGLGQLSNIIFRLKELATQAANGTLSRVQRVALDKEAFALTNEWNRITETTRFNGLNLLDGQFGQLAIQMGYGSSGQIGFGLGTELDHATGLMTFGTNTNYAGGTVLRDVTIGDVNNDGVLDMVSAAFNDALGVRVFMGNGDGTFQAPVSYRAVAGAFGATAVDLADVNNDGWQDIIALSQTSENTVNVLLNNRNGTFNDTGRAVLAAGTGPNSVDVGDLNGDGRMDIVEGNITDSTIDIFYGNGDGTFQSRVTHAVGGAGMSGVNLGDMNGDGRLDIMAHTANGVSVFLNQGNGFGPKSTYGTGNASGVGVRSLATGDINHDGILDVVAPSFGNSTVFIFLGNGDGTLGAATTLSAGTGPYNTVLGDLDNDGYLDLLVSGNTISGANIFRGNGDGTFTQTSSYGSVVQPLVAALGDLNGDGVLDVATTGSTTTVHVKLQQTENQTTVQRFNLTTQAEARSALALIEQVFQRVTGEIGAVGSIQSRLETGIDNLRTVFENYRAAESRIRDVDVAQESSELVRAKIIEQLSASILAQANQTPAIGLLLLKGK